MRKKEVIIGWVSRHSPRPAQIRWLFNKFGNITLVRISRTFRDAREVIKDLRKNNVQYAVVVLPLSIIAKLLEFAKDITFLWADMELIQIVPRSMQKESIPNFNEDSDVLVPSGDKLKHFRFKEFRKIVKLELVLEPF